MKVSDVEWIVVYDGNGIDERILQYERNIPILLYSREREDGDPMGGMLRNVGIEHASGDYLYFLDDDNIVHPLLYSKIIRYMDYNQDKIIIFNQFDSKFNRRINRLGMHCISDGIIDTAQFVVPRKYKTRWVRGVKRFEEIPYMKNLIEEAGECNIIWIDRPYAYRNYLRK